MVLKKCSADQYKLSIYDSINLINDDDWREIHKDQNLYLSIQYLRALESSMSEHIEFRYLMFYDAQVKPSYQEYLPKFGDKFSKAFLNKLGFKIMICGNTFVTGENGFIFCKTLDKEVTYALLNDGLLRLRNHEKEEDRVSVFLLKEFWQESKEIAEKTFKKYDYKGFSIDVDMILKINPNWNNLDDYLADMKTKFRTKAKAAFKRSEKIRVKELRTNELETHKDRIDELFQNVLKKANFKLSDLNGQSFVNFKRQLKENNIVLGYFLNDDLIGFSSSFIDNSYLDANYVGLDYDLNQEHSLYSRMLYDFVEMSIRKGITELRLGRTAETIKTGIGAEPADLRLYIKHTNKLSNKILQSLIKNISPSDFDARKPFKIDYYK